MNDIFDLRIADYLDSTMVNPLIVDFTIIGLKKEMPNFEKGRKVDASYTNHEGDVVVRKSFTDINNGIEILFEWMSVDGSVGLSKIQMVEMSAAQIGDFRRKRRQRAISYMIEGAKGTPAEGLVNALFTHYTVEADEYVQIGDTVLEDAINNETDATILAYLAVVMDESGETVKDRMLYQIT